MGFTDSIDALLLSHKKQRVRRTLGRSIAVCFLLHAAAVFMLREVPSLTDSAVAPAEWTWSALSTQLSDYRGDTVDCVLIFLLQAPLLVALGYLAQRVGSPPRQSDSEQAAAAAVTPLLINGETTTETLDKPRDRKQPKEEHVRQLERKKRRELRQNIAVGALFVVSTVVQVYLGIKAISYEGTWKHDHTAMAFQGTLMGVCVLLVNVESWLMKRFVHASTAEEGHLVKAFHPHPLFFQDKLTHHVCDLCRAKSGAMYRCATCDFDACPLCFNKKDKSTGEGVLRSDKGLREKGEMTNFQYLLRGLRLVGGHKYFVLLALLCVAATAMLRLYLPNFQGEIFDRVIAGTNACQHFGRNETRPPHVGSCSDARGAFQAEVEKYLACSLALGLLGGLSSLCFQLIARHVTIRVRAASFKAIIRQDIAFFDGMRVGDLTQRMGGDVSRMLAPISNSLSSILQNSMLLVGGVVFCFLTSWRLSMVAYTTVLPIMHATEAYAKWSGKINREIYQHYSDANSIATEAFSNIRTVRALSTEPFEVARVAECFARALKLGVRDALLGALTTSFNNYLDLGASVMLLWYGGGIAIDPEGTITVGALIKYQLYWNMINNSYQALNNMLNAFTRAAGAAERVLSLVDLEPDISSEGGAPASAIDRWSIRFDDVAFRYQMRPENPVLSGMSFEVPAGTVTALVGTSGGGKSTLVHLMLRFYDPRAGRISIGGVDYRELNLPSVHRLTGVVSQETQLFNDTILANIKYGTDGDVSDEAVRAAAAAAQADGFIRNFEDGYLTRVGDRGQRLSGGQKQRIAIARCLLRKPKLLLLDEATSALDAENEAQVQAALDALIWTGEHTVVLVAHRLSTVINAHAIMVIDGGAVREQGTHAELLARSGVYAQLVSRQLQRAADAGAPGPAPAAAASAV